MIIKGHLSGLKCRAVKYPPKRTLNVSYDQLEVAKAYGHLVPNGVLIYRDETKEI